MITDSQLALCAHLNFRAGQAEAVICRSHRGVTDCDEGSAWNLIEHWQGLAIYPAEVFATKRLIKLTFLGISASCGKTGGASTLLRRWIEGVHGYTLDLREKLPAVLWAHNDD